MPVLCRRVDLDPVVEVEELLGALAQPHHRVEGAQQGASVDAARSASVAVEVGRAVPALDADRLELTLSDQVLDRPERGPVAVDRLEPHAVVVGQATRGRHAVRPRGPADELTVGLVEGGRRGREHVGGQHPLGKVVPDLELAVAPGDGDLAGHVEVVERALGGRPVPSPVLLVPRQAVIEVARGGGSPVGDLGHQVLDELLADLAPPPLVLLGAVGVHPEPHHRPQLDRHQRLHVRPVLDQPPRLPGAGSGQQVDVVGTHAGVQRHEVRSLQHVDRVDLQHAGAFDGAAQGAQGRRVVGLVEESLRRQRDPPGLRLRERCHHAATLTTATDTASRRIFTPERRRVGASSPRHTFESARTHDAAVKMRRLGVIVR